MLDYHELNCPLCGQMDIIELEKINKKDLCKLYKRFTKMDFAYLLKQDIRYCECKNCKLRFYDPLITGDEKFYNSLQRFDWYYLNDKEEFVAAIKFIGSDDRVLEVGSGKGAFAKHINIKKYIGLDPSIKAKELAAQNGIVIENEMIQNYAKKHPNEFDAVVSFQVLEHVFDPKKFIESQLYALKSSGKLIIAVPSEDSFLKYVNNGILNMPPHHVTRWCDETLMYIAKQYDLELIDIYHEKVAEIHKKIYMSTLIQNIFMQYKMISNSFIRKIFLRFISILSWFLVSALPDEMLPNGHTVIAVYRKK